MRFATRAIHAGDRPSEETGAVVVPIYQTSTFREREPGAEGEYVYSRTGNPTRAALEAALASLEEGRYGLAFASGMAAESTLLLSLLKKGDHVLAVRDLYGGTRRLFDRIMSNFGIQFTYVKGSDSKDFASGLTPETKIVWLESPTNPLLKIVDIEAAAKVAHRQGASVVVDNTFQSPYLQQPLKLGADVVVHSTTKYLGGHSDLVGGGIVLSDSTLYEKVHFAQNVAGAVPGPFDSWLVLRGIKTLAVRMDRHCANSQRVAEFLTGHPKVRQVIYPGLPSHPQHELAKKQMTGFGGMISFHLKGDFESSKRFLKALRVFSLAESLGGVESLAEHPRSMTHASVPRDELDRIGISESLIRLSVGIEDAEDLVTDLSNGLEQV